MSTSMDESQAEKGVFYRAVWRLHFYAGILVAPFAIFLAITGAIYLWKPQYEQWRYRQLLEVPVSATFISAEAQIETARASVPAPWKLQSYQPPFEPNQSAQIGFQKPGGRSAHGASVTVYVDPHSGKVLGRIDEDDRFMRKIHDLHGTLLAGKIGEYLVELAASWALVLFATGIYLWWPRPRFAVWGFLLPRLGAKGRILWRDVHVVPAIWLSFATLFLLATGLLWTQASGKWYRTLSAAIGQGTPRESIASAHRSEFVGWAPPLQAGLAEKIDALESSEELVAPLSIDRVLEIALKNNVPAPYTVAMPIGLRGVFSVISDRNHALKRTFLHLDQYSGRVLADVRFPQFGLLAQFSLWGIVAHEGQLFGLANQILGSVAALGVFLLGASGLVLWWQRRPAAELKPVAAIRLPRAVLAVILCLALFLPLLALSLLVLVVFEGVIGAYSRKSAPA